MAREIKFRAWDTETNKWYKGGDGIIGWRGETIFQNDDIIDFRMMEGAKYFVFMQYTGLKDSKQTDKYPEGQEIYEGDIVNIKYSQVGYDEGSEYTFNETSCEVVEFADGMFQTVPSGLPLDRGIEVEGAYVTNVEVIGNIYDNPEQLALQELAKIVGQDE